MQRHTWLAAAAITVGFVLAEYLPGRMATLYSESLGPLMATSWLSFVCHQWWRDHQASVLRLPTSGLVALLGVAAFVLMFGGFRLLWVDPWLFAPMLWPLVEIALTLRKGRRGSTAGADILAGGTRSLPE